MRIRIIPSIYGLLLLGISQFVQVCAGGGIAIFDGKTLDGWEGNTNTWRVENGSIVAGFMERKQPHNDFLATKKEYRNLTCGLSISWSERMDL